MPLWAPLALNVVFGTFLSFLFSFLALRRLTATAVGITASSEVIFAFLVAWVWLGESLTLVQLVGAAVVLAGIILAQTARASKVVDADLALAPAMSARPTRIEHTFDSAAGLSEEEPCQRS